LEIPSAGRAIEIQNFTGKIEAGREPTFQGVGTDLFQGDAAGRDHAFLESTGSPNRQRKGGEMEAEAVFLLGGELGESLF
jgi:hypothetical protein